MGKTYRGSEKDEMKDRHRQVRDERQNKRHLNDNEEDRRQTKDRCGDDEHGSRNQKKV